MRTWQGDLLQKFKGATALEEVCELLTEEAIRLGFEYVGYGLKLKGPSGREQALMLNNYPQEWADRYRERGYVQVDPSVRHCAATIAPVVWNERLYRECPAFWEEARATGLRFGYAQSSVDAKGRIGMLTLCRSADPIGEAEAANLGLQASWLCQVAHWIASDVLVASHGGDTGHPQLSPRESAVMKWTAGGKTSSEIATILGIAERTVNFHITNVMTKLNCVNKTAACVSAVMLGLLEKG